MPYLISSRNFAFLLTIADLWRVSSNANGVWLVLIIDALALVFICFADEIDDLTFGQWVGQAAGRIDVHTPPFLIALFGWIILLLNTAMLFFTAWIGSASHN
jgi:hypothetical protein